MQRHTFSHVTSHLELLRDSEPEEKKIQTNFYVSFGDGYTTLKDVKECSVEVIPMRDIYVDINEDLF